MTSKIRKLSNETWLDFLFKKISSAHNKPVLSKNF